MRGLVPRRFPGLFFQHYYVDIVNITMYKLLRIANCSPPRGIQTLQELFDVFLGKR
jgi:hypothetical protein